MKNPSSIRRELLRSLSGSLVLLYAVGALLIFFIVKGAVERQADELLRQKLRDFAEDTRVMSPSNVPGQGAGQVFHDFFDWEYGQLFDDTGRPLRVSRALEGRHLPFRRAQERAILIEDLRLPDGRPGRVGYLTFRPKVHRRGPPDFRGQPPVVNSPGNPPHRGGGRRSFDLRGPPLPEPVHLAVAIPVDDEKRTLRTLGVTLLGTGLLLTWAVFFVVRHQVQKSLRPVEQLVELTTTIHPGQLSLRLPCDDLPVELRPLVGQFNTLLDRLETAFVREKSFSANIGHEIRTPLTELAALLGNALEDIGQANPEESPGEVYRDADEICRHMNRLVEVISSIHQAESGRELVSVSPVDPGALLEDVLQALKEEIDNAGLKVSVRDGREREGLTVDTDRTLLRAMIQNLLSNAIVHSVSDGEIVCEINGAGQDDVEIRISNSPRNIQADDLEHLTEPFWQKDGSRSSRGNFGLGLSLVEKYAGLVHAKTSFALEGNRFVAILRVPDLPEAAGEGD